MAVKVASEVDIIEIGTPLCKAAGLEAIRSIREIVPDKLILADFKSPDVGGLEAKMAFDTGADMMTVMAARRWRPWSRRSTWPTRWAKRC